MVRPEYFGATTGVGEYNLRLMTWLRAVSGHQQPWYWACAINWMSLYLPWDKIYNQLHHCSVGKYGLNFFSWGNHENLKTIHLINTLRLEQNGQHFADNVFKCIFFSKENSMHFYWSLIGICFWGDPRNKCQSNFNRLFVFDWKLCIFICILGMQWCPQPWS